MKSKFKILLVFSCLLASTTVYAELSMVNKQRVGKGMLECKEENNELIYKDYWKDSVKPENLKSVCMAERFADQVAAEGEIWLENEAVALIYLCGEDPDSRKSFFSCMRTRLDEVAEDISEPCVELGSEKLWSEDKCKRLVSYIFLNKFNRIFLNNNIVSDSFFPFSFEILTRMSPTRFLP